MRLLALALTCALATAGTARADQPAADQPATYLFVEGVVTDRAGFGAYTQALPPLYERWGGEYYMVAAPSSVTKLAGPGLPRSMVVSKWPDRDAVEGFWWSPAYQDDTVPLREKAGSFDVVAFPGVAAQEPGGAFLLAYGGEASEGSELLAFVTAFADRLPEGARQLAAVGPEEVVRLEGFWPGRSAWLVRFPNLTALQDFWQREAVQRGWAGIADSYRVLAIEGIGPGR